MRPVVVPAILLLVVLMSPSDSEAGSPAEMCRTQYPTKPCPNTNLDEGWLMMGDNRCVKVFVNTQYLGHTDAEMVCRKYPTGHLVAIHNDVDLNRVQCAMHKASTDKYHYWIGAYLTQVGAARVWAWTDNTGFGYTHWAHGQPDFYMLREWCGEMNYWDWGLWNDVDCHEKKPYVCAVYI